MPEFNPQEFLKSRGYSDDQLKKIFKPPGDEPAAPTEEKSEPAAANDGSPAPIAQDRPSQVALGALQGGVLDPIEGIGQAFEHYTGTRIPIPQSMRDYFDRAQKEAHSTGLGRAGEIGGAVGAMLTPLGWVGKAAKAVEAVRGARALNTAREAATVGKGAAREMNLGEMAQASKGAREIREASKTSNFLPRLTKAEKEAGRPLTKAEQAEVRAGGKGPGPPPPPPPTPGLASRIAKGTARGAASGAIGAAAQPVRDVKDEDFTQQKLLQTAAGGLLGGASGGLAHVPLSQIAHSIRHNPFHALSAASLPAYLLYQLGLGHIAAPVGISALIAGLLGRGGPGAIRGAGAGTGQLLENLNLGTTRDEQP